MWEYDRQYVICHQGHIDTYASVGCVQCDLPSPHMATRREINEMKERKCYIMKTILFFKEKSLEPAKWEKNTFSIVIDNRQGQSKDSIPSE